MKNVISRNHIAFLSAVLILATPLLFNTGCSTLTNSPNFNGDEPNSKELGRPKKILVTEPVKLELKSIRGESEVSKFHSRSINQTFEGGVLRYEVSEIVDFTVEVKTKAVDEKTGTIDFLVTTTEKSGPTSLADLGYPELGESFDLVLRKDASVVKAGKFPKNSMYYVPPISLPKGEVKIGDTWQMEHRWNSSSNNIPLKITLVSILKSFYECGALGKCAEVEISGNVIIDNALGGVLDLKSEVKGRLLINLGNGSIIWSEVRNIEEINNEGNRVVVRSCTESLVTDPVSKRWLWRSTPDCDPKSEIISPLPGTKLN
jgi:hypothetical protein